MGKQGNRCQQSHIRKIWTNTHTRTFVCASVHKARAYACKESAITFIPVVMRNMFLPLLMRNSKGYINCCFATLFLWTQRMNMHPFLPTLEISISSQIIPPWYWKWLQQSHKSRLALKKKHLRYMNPKHKLRSLLTCQNVSIFCSGSF